MTTSGDGSSVPGSNALPATPAFPGDELGRQIAQLANAMFSAPVGAAPQMPALAPAAASSVTHALPAVVPPRMGPNAFNVGGGGLSTASTLPPFPGFAHSLPIASAPPPKESDLRSGVSLGAEQLGLPSTLLAQTPEGIPPNALGGGFPSPFSVPPSFPTSMSPSQSGQGALPDSFSVPLVSAGMPGMPGLQSPSAPSLPVDARAPHGGTPSFGADTPAGLAPSSVSAPSAPPRWDSDYRPELVPELRRTPSLFDPYAVKRDFPILRERVHGKPLVWLDNAATTQKPQSVIDRLSYFYEHENSNIHRAAHALAARATDAYEAARDKTRRFLNAPSPDTIVFARGATEAINLVAQSWGRRHLSAGDEVVITWLEHHANIVPWQMLAKEKGIVLRVVPVDDRGQVDLEAYERLLGPKTRLVSITQVSNALGTIVPVTEMTQMAHRYGACVMVDGAQAVSHQRVDVQAIDCEFYVFSGHKIFAPTGIGVLYGKRHVLESMPPWQGGGNMISDVRFEKTTYQPPPARFEAGTGNIGDAVGLGAALDYVTSLGIENISRYEHELLEYGTERLLAIPGLTLIGTAPDKAGVLSFVLRGLRNEDVGAALDQEGIAVRSGHHCAQPILRRFGHESSIRASLAPYNTKEDLDALVAALLRIQAKNPAAPL